jgi:Putative peptidoglycan binding domain
LRPLRLWMFLTAALLTAAVCLGQSSGSTTSKKATSPKKATHRRSRHHRSRGQQKIDAKRAHEIQEALIREHYLSGKPSGKWDTATQNALVRYQGDNGWQTKVVPDSRALIKLGLGPDQDHLLNPESAMTTVPPPDPSHASSAADPAGDDPKKQQ